MLLSFLGATSGFRLVVIIKGYFLILSITKAWSFSVTIRKPTLRNTIQSLLEFMHVLYIESDCRGSAALMCSKR